MWPDFIHHLFLHFPIVLTMVLAVIGLYSLRARTDTELRVVLRWGGWVTFAATSIAAISGIIAAPGALGGEGPAELTHHRDLAITTWFVIGLAASCYDYGIRHDVRDMRTFAITMWCVAVFGVIGTGHWGGSSIHTDVVPF